MRRLSALLVLLLSSFTASAESFFQDATIGIAVISQSADVSISGSGDSNATSESGIGMGVYLEKYDQKKYRYNATFSIIGYDDFDIYGLVASADYILPLNYNFSAFAGVSAGAAMQNYTSISDSAVAPVYGVQFGGILYVSDQLMLELGYRIRPTSLETEVEIPAGTVVEVDDLSEAYLNILIGF